MTQTKKQMAGAQRRSLRAMREKLLKMSADWDDCDQYNMNMLTELADHVKHVAGELIEDTDQ